MEIVIGLIGAKRAGKTTAFETIKDVAEVQEITLAAKLKDVCAEVFNVPRNAFDSHDLKEKELKDLKFLDASHIKAVFKAYGVHDEVVKEADKYIRQHIGKILTTPRQIAQYIGTEVLRTYDEDIHCKHAALAITKRIGVVTDMRFPNEYSYFSKNYEKFYPIYIKNNGAELEAGKDTHASEAYLQELAKKAVETLPNNSGIREFQESVRKFIKGIL